MFDVSDFTLQFRIWKFGWLCRCQAWIWQWQWSLFSKYRSLTYDRYTMVYIISYSHPNKDRTVGRLENMGKLENIRTLSRIPPFEIDMIIGSASFHPPWQASEHRGAAQGQQLLGSVVPQVGFILS